MSFPLLKRKKYIPENKILIIRFSSIGDIVLTSPVVRCLKQQLPGYEIHYLTKTGFRDIVAYDPNIDKVFTIEYAVEEISDALIKENYSYVIDLHNNLRSFQVKWRLWRAKIYTCKKPWFRRWLYIQTKWRLMPDEHVVDRYFKAVRPLGIKNDNRGLSFTIPAEAKVARPSLPFTHIAGYAALAIGASHTTKKLPLDQLNKLCRELPLPVVLIGGPEEAGTGILLEAEDPFKIYNGCGKFSLLASASIISEAKWVITHDTGMMHIAAAFKRKIISIWGSTVPDFGFYPYLPEGGTSLLIEATGVNCRPCHKHGKEKCPKGHFNCMLKIDTARIAGVISNAARR